MSNDNCLFCGKKLNTVFANTKASAKTLKALEEIGITEKNICQDCASNKLEGLEKERNQKEELLTKKKEELKSLILKMSKHIKIFTTPHPESWNAEIKGVVTGYTVIGTGPISTLASAFTDILGKESNVYLEKIRKGENSAMTTAKIQAIELGADTISGFHITVTEATSGHGMIMISCVGTGISTGRYKEEFRPIAALKAEIEKLEEEVSRYQGICNMC